MSNSVPIDIEHFKKVLQNKEQELITETTQLEQTARDSRVAEVQDPMDEVTSDEGKTAAFNVSSITADMLSQVRAALQRIDTGEYGICVDCERPIGEKRLEAVPWTPYCIEDQERHDKEDKLEPSPFDSVI